LLPHSNRWKGDPIGFVNAMKGPPKGRFMKQRNKLHHHLEAGKPEAIVGIIIKGMGMSNHRKIISLL
jgi:hypothetical protein